MSSPFPQRSSKWEAFRAAKAAAAEEFNAIEDWYTQELNDQKASHVDAVELSKRKLGMKYLVFGRFGDPGELFFSLLFPHFQGDVHVSVYEEAVRGILKLAGKTIGPRSRHKFTFDLGTFYFSADNRGSLVGVVASCDFPMEQAYQFVFEMTDLLNRVDSSDLTGPNCLQNHKGLHQAALETWQRFAREGDGTAYPRMEVAMGAPIEIGGGWI